jgi:hypothetical protein
VPLTLSTAVCAFNPSPYRFSRRSEAVSERVALRLEELDVLPITLAKIARLARAY